MKKFRYYIESASGVRRGFVLANSEQEADRQVRESFRRNYPAESIWVLRVYLDD